MDDKPTFEEYITSIELEDPTMKGEMEKVIKESGVGVHINITIQVIGSAELEVHKNKGIKHFICIGFRETRNPLLEMLSRAFYNFEMLRLFRNRYKKKELKRNFITLIREHHENLKIVEEREVRGLMFMLFFEMVRLAYVFLGYPPDITKYTEFMKKIALTPVK